MDLASKQFLFIIGSPRSGTTMLQILLGQHPQVATTVELTLFSRYIAPWLEQYESEVRNRAEKGWKQGLPMLWETEENDEFLREFLRRAYAKVDERTPGRPFLLDKSPGYGLHVHTIRRLLPRSKFIHLIRDGRDVACSLLAARESMGFGMPRLVYGGQLWARWVRGAREAARYEGDYLELRYEDFLTEGVERYAQMLEFCGLSVDRDWIARMLEENTFEKMRSRGATADPRVTITAHHYRQGQAGRWGQDFTPRDRFEFDQVAGPLLQELGYAQPGWWAEQPWENVLLPLENEARRRAYLVQDAGRLLLKALRRAPKEP